MCNKLDSLLIDIHRLLGAHLKSTVELFFQENLIKRAAKDRENYITLTHYENCSAGKRETNDLQNSVYKSDDRFICVRTRTMKQILFPS